MNEPQLLVLLSQSVDDLWQVESYVLNSNPEPALYPFYKFWGETATNPEKALGQEWLAASLERLLEACAYNENEVTRLATLIYFRPSGWYAPYGWDYSLPPEKRFINPAKGIIIQEILRTWLRLHRHAAKIALLSERMVNLLGGAGASEPPNLYPPTLADCLELLLADPSEDAALVGGQLAVGALGRARVGSVEEPELRRYAPALYNRLWQQSRFNYAVFRQAMFALPNIFADLSRPLDTVPPPDFYRGMPINFAVAIQDFYHTLTVELAEALPQNKPEVAKLLKKVAVLHGAAWLLLACAYIETSAIKRLPAYNRWHSSTNPASAAIRLCQTMRPAAAEEQDSETLAFLSHYKPATLLMVLPFAPAYQDLVCQALEWDGAWKLVQIIEGKLPLTEAATLALTHPVAQAILETFSIHRPSKRPLINKITSATA